jgi:acetyl-CoA acyltransferase
MIGLLAELPLGMAGVTVNRFCGSSKSAVHMAAGAIALGAGRDFSK